MPKGQLLIKNLSFGFSLVEILLAVSLFGLLVTVLTGAMIYGQQSTALAGGRARAVFLTDEGLEAVRNIRDANFANLADGTYGLAISGNQWTFSGTSDTTDIFTRQIVISQVDVNTKRIESTVTWSQSLQRPGAVSLTTYLTKWQAGGGGGPPPTCAAYCQSLGTYSNGSCRQNTVQCTQNSEVYESGGDAICITNFPGDASHDTCCCLP